LIDSHITPVENEVFQESVFSGFLQLFQHVVLGLYSPEKVFYHGVQGGDVRDMDSEKIQALKKEIYARNFTKFGFDLNPVVSVATVLFILLFSLFALFNLDLANRLFASVQSYIVSNFDWVFILSSNFFIIVCLYLALTRLGNVRIGGVDSKPEFTNFSWYSMLISAGMGIGLMFWAVGEPLHHVEQTLPIFTEAEPAIAAMATTFFHWGLHPWGIYALISLALAFFAYNKNLPLSLRSVFYPLLKERVHGIAGDVIDTFAVLSTMFGLATSLGLGVMQINSGLDYLMGIGTDVIIQVLLIAGITAIAIVSVVLGVNKGIRVLSRLNIKLAFVFMVAVLLLGPTFYILRVFSNSLGVYISNLLQIAFFIDMDSGAWQGNWTIFYLAWWISWSPFVGMFIARMSRGRTVREFVFGVLIIPSLLSFVWLSVFGGAAMYVDIATEGGLFAVVSDNLPVALFELLSLLQYPLLTRILPGILSVLATLLVVSYFVTSSDSGSLVVDKITSGGKLKSPVRQRVLWACLEGLLATTLLLIGGEMALDALQAAVISSGLPLAVMLSVMTVSLIKGIQESKRKQRQIRDTKRLKDIFKTFNY